MTLAGFVWACVWKRRSLAGEGDHLPTRSGLNRGPSRIVHLGLVGTRIWEGICDRRWVGRELRLSRSAFASTNRQGAAVERACAAAWMRRSSGAVRVLHVRIDWHVKRSTNNQVELRAVQSQAGEGLTGRRHQIKCTQLQLSGSA